MGVTEARRPQAGQGSPRQLRLGTFVHPAPVLLVGAGFGAGRRLDRGYR